MEFYACLGVAVVCMMVTGAMIYYRGRGDGYEEGYNVGHNAGLWGRKHKRNANAPDHNSPDRS